MAQTNSNKRAETELVLAASIQRLLDKTVRAARPQTLQGLLCKMEEWPVTRQEAQKSRGTGNTRPYFACVCSHNAALDSIS